MSVGDLMVRARHARTLSELAAVERDARAFLDARGPSEAAHRAAERGINQALDAALDRLCAAEVSR